MARRNILISRLPSKLHRVQSPPLESVLRMLVIISAPNDPSCAPLDTEKERDRILQAVDKLYVHRKIEVDFTDDATFETIQSYLNEKDYHIVHFTGHGTEIDGQGFLVLENEDLTASAWWTIRSSPISLPSEVSGWWSSAPASRLTWPTSWSEREFQLCWPCSIPCWTHRPPDLPLPSIRPWPAAKP